MRSLFLVLLAIAAAACGGGGGGDDGPAPETPAAEVNLLFMGNSHTANHDLPALVASMVRAARPGRTVAAVRAPGSMFLEDHAANATTLALVDARRWDFVVLQAQKYSESGQFQYPIDGAVALARRARAGGAIPILFPEWPRRGIPETARIFELHRSIAQQEPACVAPIPQAWDLAAARHPGLALHAADGNHAARPGAFLAALVIATTMTGVAPDTLPFLADAGIDPETQAQLRALAAETVLAYAPRMHCPADPLVP